jgi:predicted ATP-grasp superfamily ATP-dependent carboligase
MKKKLRILITGVGGPTPRSFARAIKEIGNYADYTLIGTDIHPYAIGHYQTTLFEKSYITPRSADPNYWNFMEQLIVKEAIDLAVILPEQEVLEWSNRESIGSLPCKALIPPLKAVQKMLDKGILTDALASSGLVPISLLIDPLNENLKTDTESVLNYPYWIRSATGSSGLGSYKIECFEDLQRWIAINKDIHNFIASEYLAGRNLACKFLYFKGKLYRSALAERVHYIMAKVSPSGITGNTSFGRLINDEVVFERAHKAIETMFDISGAEKHGFYTVDLKEDGAGIPYITEINVRHVAFTQCLAMGGANLCEDTIRLLDGDGEFDRDFHLYQFDEGLIFLRDVDERPIVMRESDLNNDVSHI